MSQRTSEEQERCKAPSSYVSKERKRKYFTHKNYKYFTILNRQQKIFEKLKLELLIHMYLVTYEV